MECWLVRHGESTWNAAGRFQGGLDAPLSRRGQNNASITRVALPAGRLLALNETHHLAEVAAEAPAP